MQDRRIKMMKLWLLNPKQGKFVDFDVYEGFVVRAASSRRARELAVDHSHDIRWKDREWSSCELVRLEMKPAVILASFKAG
jgi:hypothetical protein